MNRFILKENKTFKEKYYLKTLDSGFKIIYIPKDLPTTAAFLCCDFGGADVEYILGNEKFTLPYGTAHFLEHKMFETATGRDAFLEFDNFGGNANAYTSYENTCYYFTCTENFYENLNVLLGAVSSFHCTESSVEKEKKIIAREITMYDDQPSSVVTRNLYKSLYHNHPATVPISGTVESISGITREVLYRAYNHFYVPSNLTLCVCGNADMEKIAEYCENYFGEHKNMRPTTVFESEPTSVVTENTTEKGGVATPLFSIGIKCPPMDITTIDFVRKSTALRIAVSLTFGRASDFYCENYALGLLSERFYGGYTASRNNAYVVISGSSNNPIEVMEKAIAELDYRKNHFFTEEQILREKKAAYAESITLFDSCEDLASTFVSNAFYSYDEYDCIEILRDITSEEIKEALFSLDLSNKAISIIQKG